jgi:hypothetical protein
MGAAVAGPCRPLSGQHFIHFILAFSQWERLVPAPADLSLVNNQHAFSFISKIDFAGARAFSQWERLVPAPADLSVVNMLLDNESAAMLGMEVSFHALLWIRILSYTELFVLV